MDKPVLATVTGTMLTPGVSRNNRLYTQSAIGRAVKRMQERLKDEDALPLVMRTHHSAGDDSTRIVGRITSVQQQNDGSATYEAKLYNNTAGRDIATLLSPDAKDGKSALRTTSIYGYWVGPVEHVQHNGSKVETGEDLEIDAIDFTGSPGVPASKVQSITFESSTRDKRSVLMESVEATVTVETDAVSDDELEVWERAFTAKQRKSMAASGQAMTGGRYPIANKSDLRNAIRAVGRGSGSHDEIRRHIIKRARALGLSDLIPDSWSGGGARKENTMPAKEHFVKVMVGDMCGDELKVCAYNLHPDVIKDAVKQAGKMIDQILGQDGRDLMDMDEDDCITDVDDIDWKVVTCSPEGTDYDSDDVNTMPDGTMPQETARRIRRKLHAARENTNTTEKESVVPDETKTTAVEQAAPGLTEADMAKIAAIVAAAVAETFKPVGEAMKDAADSLNAVAKAKAKKKDKPADADETGPAESQTKTATAVETLTAEALDKKLADERAKVTAEIRETLLKEGGVPQRRGYRAVSESDTDMTPSGDELWDKRDQIWAQFFPWGQTEKVDATPTA